MTARAVFGPLVSGATYRRGVHLLLGAVILLPYLLLTAAFAQMFAAGHTPPPAAGLLLAVSVLIAVVPAFLNGTRALEIAAARSLLDVELPDPAGTRPDRETRLRAAVWFAAHLLFGGIVGAALLIALPMALIFIAQRFGFGAEALAGLWLGPFDEHDTGWLTLIGVVLLLVILYLVAGLGALAAVMAPVLLGPSQTERIAALQAQADQLAERNRLARELHDSVGHALTVAVLQAGAARELLGRDPQFASRALQAIEETGRAAMDDLDYVLGALREHDTRKPVARGEQLQRAPQRTLADLDRLVADTRATGLPVTVEVVGVLDALPAVVSREGYRIVQEGLTNAARHAGRQPVTLRICVRRGELDLELVNLVTDRPAAAGARPGEAGAGADRAGRDQRDRRGRGLAGMRERVALLGGRMTAGYDGSRWRVSVQLPIRRGAGGTGGPE